MVIWASHPSNLEQLKNRDFTQSRHLSELTRELPRQPELENPGPCREGKFTVVRAIFYETFTLKLSLSKL